MTDSLADLHASVSLLRQGRAILPAVVAAARAQDRSWAQIAAQLEPERHNSVRTRNARLSAIRSFFRYAAAMAGLHDSVPCVPYRR